MKISVAQNRPVIGDVKANLAGHKTLVTLAASNGASLIVFPELSLAGYEPKIADQVATGVEDAAFEDLQLLSNEHQIVIGAGMPVRHGTGVTITMIIFHPNRPRQTYSKKYLHADEEPFFISGENFPDFTLRSTKIALAICYEISVPQHTASAVEGNPAVYVASVAKFARHMHKTIETLRATAKNNNMVVMMSNCLGLCDGEECVGSSLAIDKTGKVIDQLDDQREGVLILDLQSNKTVKKYV